MGMDERWGWVRSPSSRPDAAICALNRTATGTWAHVFPLTASRFPLSPILTGLSQQEEQLDKALKKLEDMDEDDFEKLRQKRLEKMKKQAQQKHEWTLQGHGS